MTCSFPWITHPLNQYIDLTNGNTIADVPIVYMSLVKSNNVNKLGQGVNG